MNQIRKIFQGLSIRQRVSLILVAVLAIAALYAFTQWNHERDFKPLYSNLSSEDAAAVLAKLTENAAEYRFGDSNSTILVPSKRIPELRLQMASAGIPKSGRIGYELFDRTNLGTTDFTEQVNYHRAIEGELERSIMCMNEVEQARVHITFPKDSVFTENREPAKASVMVKLKLGKALSPQNAQAISQLVSSAVEGLAPEATSVMDMQGNLLVRPKNPGDGSEPSEELLTWKKQLENETLAKINSVLDPLLGSEKYRASVDVDCDQTSGEQSEETFDPNRSVITTSQRTEEGSINRESGAAVPGTQSNLPRPTPRASGGLGGGVARRTESMNYETSRTVRRIKLPQGIIRRMSISVLIDHKMRWEAGKGKGAAPKKIVEPVSPEEIKIIHDVVAAAAGFNSTRGDQLTVDSLPFQATLRAQPPDWMTPAAPTAPKTALPLWKQPAVLIGGGLTLLVLLGAGFLMIGSRRKARVAMAELQKQLEAVQTASQPAKDQAHSIEPAAQPAAVSAAQEGLFKQVDEVRDSFRLPPLTTTKTEVLTRQVVEEARKDPSAMAQIVRSWLNEAS
jgi:flagellar M-ring protein FliF